MTMKNKKIKNNLFKVGLISLIIINFSLLVFVGWLFFNTYIPKDTPQSFDEIISNCDYSNTERTINCFRDNIFTFFKYNLSNPEIYRLKEENVFYIYDKEDERMELNQCNDCKEIKKLKNQRDRAIEKLMNNMSLSPDEL